MITSKTIKEKTIEEFETHPCTYSKFGEYNYNQSLHNCEKCDPDKEDLICWECFTTCHKDCGNKPVGKNITMGYFVCDCGKNEKHKTESKKAKSLFEPKPCDVYLSLQQISEYENTYKCNNCSKIFCEICQEYCHYYCTESENYLYAFNNVDKLPKAKCECVHTNHYYNETFLSKDFSSLKENNEIISNHQILNSLLENGIFDNLFNQIETNLNKFLKGEKLPDSQLTSLGYNCYYLIQYLVDIKYSYYYHENHDIVDKSTMIDYIMKIDVDKRDIGFNYNYFDVICMMYIGMHLSTDYNNFKFLNVYDYMNTNVADRFKYKEIMNSSLALKDKYGLYSTTEQNKIIKLMCKLTDYLTISFDTTYCLYLMKLIYKTLKLNIYTLHDLNDLTKNLFDAYSWFTENIRTEIQVNEESTLKKLYILNKIIFMIAYNYNDLVILDMMNNHKENKFFIHSISEHGQMLLKMLINNSNDNNLCNDKKRLTLHHEALKLFTIGDNQYYTDLTEMEDFKDFKNFKILLNKLTSQSHQLSSFYKMTEELRDNLNAEIQNYFLLKFEDNELRIKNHFTDYSNKVEKFFQNIKPLNIPSKKYKYKKLILKVQNDFNFVNNDNFIQHIETVLSIYKILYIDETVSKIILMLNTKHNELNSEVMNICLSFQTQFLFTKEGLSQICLGRNLRIITNIFKTCKDKSSILKFLYLLFKSIKLNKPNIDFNKYIHELSVELFNYMGNLRITNYESLPQIFHLVKIFEFNYDFFDQEEFKKIKIGIIEQFIRTEFMSKHFVQSIFSDSKESKYDLSNVENLIKKNIEEIKDEIEYTSDDIVMYQKIFFAFIEILSKNNFYIFDREKIYKSYIHVDKLNDVEFYQNLLKKNYLSLGRRKKIIKYLCNNNIYEVLENKANRKTDVMNSESYKEYIDKMESGQEGEIGYYVKRSYQKLSIFISLLEILKFEFENMLFILYAQNDYTKMDKYIQFMLLSTKSISDYFFNVKKLNETAPPDHVTLIYYKLVYETVQQINLLKLIVSNKDKRKLKSELLNYYDNKKDEVSLELYNMKNIENYFDFESIYLCAFEAFQTLNKIKYIDGNYEIENQLYNYDKQNLMNFFTIGLSLEGDFSRFYKDMDNEKTDPVLNNIIIQYDNQFKNFENTNIFALNKLTRIGEYPSYKQIIINNFVQYISKGYYIDEYNDNTYLLIITKLLFFDTAKMQDALYECAENNSSNFYSSLFAKLYKSLLLCEISARNMLMNRIYFQNINIKTKLILQFIQLLSEGYKTDFHKYFLDDIEVNDLKTIFEDVKEYDLQAKNFLYDSDNYKNEGLYDEYNLEIQYFGEDELTQRHFYLFIHDRLCQFAIKNIFKETKVSAELPNDNLLILKTNLINFLIEYTSCMDPESDIFSGQISTLFDKTSSILLIDGKNLSDYRQMILFDLKISMLNLLISVFEGSKFKNVVVKDTKKIKVSKLYEQIISCVEILLTKMKAIDKVRKNVTLESDNIYNILCRLYIYEISFQKSYELNFCITAFKYLRIQEENYKINGISKIFDKNKISNKSGTSLAGYNVYYFFNEIVTKVDIRMVIDEKIETKSIFYITPPITYLLSDQTISSFKNEVNRDSVFTKITYLISQTDYFIYEMFHNYHRSIQGDFFRIFKNIKMKTLEIFNYLLIVIQQILLLIYFFKDKQGDDANSTIINDIDKFKIGDGNMALSIIQICYIVIIMIIWFKYYADLAYQQIMMKKYNINFILRHEKNPLKFNLLRFTSDFVNDNEYLLKNINNSVTFFQKLQTIIFDLIIYNKVINVFIYNFILLIIYLATQNALCLVIPVMFITSLSSTLTNISFAVKLKWRQLSLIIMFIYIIVNIFSWISFYYLDPTYNTEVFVTDTATKLNENLCTNAIQCWINNINLGVRAGGGIGDVLPKISFFDSPNYFVKIFFFNIIFHIVIVLILGNIFLGIIVDTFAELRDTRNNYENDQKNVCFICQMSRNKANLKLIDFDEHIRNDHNMWNYVDFIIYLLINNDKDFNRIELYAYDKLMSNDITWLPFEDEDEE